MRLYKDYEAAIQRVMKAAGTATYRFEMGGKHPRLLIEHDGRSLTYTLPGSPSDHRALKNMERDLRTLLGLTAARAEAVSAARRDETLPSAAALAAARHRVADNPPAQPTPRDLKVRDQLGNDFGAPPPLTDPAAETTRLERLERLVALGLAEGDGAGRYRRSG